jgi:uncharacterized membrane protein YkgB
VIRRSERAIVRRSWTASPEPDTRGHEAAAQASQDGEGKLVPSPAGQFLIKDTVLLAAALLTAAESLRAARR